MAKVKLFIGIFLIIALFWVDSVFSSQAIISACCEKPKARRYDLKELGNSDMFHGWADVQGQGAANDYCRVLGSGENKFLACALAGTHGDNEKAYMSQITGFDIGYKDTWYMRDEDGDGRDDYCRCVGGTKGNDPERIECMKSGPLGFYGSKNQPGSQFSFTPTGVFACSKRTVRGDYGIPA